MVDAHDAIRSDYPIFWTALNGFPYVLQCWASSGRRLQADFALAGSVCHAAYGYGAPMPPCCSQSGPDIRPGSAYMCPQSHPVCIGFDTATGAEGVCYYEPYSQFPGDARPSQELPSVAQIFVHDFDRDGRMDLFLHAPALSPGSCAQRCHSLDRFGFDSFKVHDYRFKTHTPQEDVHEKSYCYCGPAYNQMIAPHPPPSPPKPPPSPFEPPSIPPIPSPDRPPPSPPFPVYRAAGM